MKPHDPTVSGDFDSLETTENQEKLLDLLKSSGKIALIASESSARFKVEKPEGLKNFLYQVTKLADENKMPDKDAIIRLEQEVRYEEREEKVGNKTEFLRVLLSTLVNTQEFKDIAGEVVREQLQISKKRGDSRYYAQDKTSRDLGL